MHLGKTVFGFEVLDFGQQVHKRVKITHKEETVNSKKIVFFVYSQSPHQESVLFRLTFTISSKQKLFGYI